MYLCPTPIAHQNGAWSNKDEPTRHSRIAPSPQFTLGFSLGVARSTVWDIHPSLPRVPHEQRSFLCALVIYTKSVLTESHACSSVTAQHRSSTRHGMLGRHFCRTWLIGELHGPRSRLRSAYASPAAHLPTLALTDLFLLSPHFQQSLLSGDRNTPGNSMSLENWPKWPHPSATMS